MALDKASMKARIKAAQAAVQPPAGNDPASARAYSEAMLEALCQGIIEELQQAAVVNVASVTLVTPGTEASGPGTGTIS